jgi:hypothetical protein
MNQFVEKNIAIARQFVTEGFANANLSIFDTALAPDRTHLTSWEEWHRVQESLYSNDYELYKQPQ